MSSCFRKWLNLFKWACTLSWCPQVLVHEAVDSGWVLTQQRGTQCKAAACRELKAPSATGKQDHPPPHPQHRALSPPAADAASLLSAHQHTLRWEIKPGEVGGMNTEQSVRLQLEGFLTWILLLQSDPEQPQIKYLDSSVCSSDSFPLFYLFSSHLMGNEHRPPAERSCLSHRGCRTPKPTESTPRCVNCHICCWV